MKLNKSKAFKTSKTTGNETISELLEKAGYIKKVSNGLYVYLNLGQRVINNINKVIREEFEKMDLLEVSLNQLQNADIWKSTDRYSSYGDEMFKIKSRDGNDMVITGTNEELCTLVAKDYIKSYRDLSFTWFQINNKFRDEINCRNGLIRSKEFIMMDAYSFNLNKEDLENTYNQIKECYCKIFNRLNLDYTIEKADSSEIGGSISEEFIVNGVEIGHIFQLDDLYSNKLGLMYNDEDNKMKNVMMGCYGIGISRMFQIISENNRKGNFLNFSKEISSYEYGIVIKDIKNKSQCDMANNIYEDLKSKGHTVILDDRKNKIGDKLYQLDMIGTYYKIIVGNKSVNNIYEIKSNGSGWEEVLID